MSDTAITERATNERLKLHWIEDLGRPVEPGIVKVPGLGSVRIKSHDLRIAEAHGGNGSFSATCQSRRGRQGQWMLHIWECDNGP